MRWYDANRRDLPWRRTREPYRVWLSEVMLQQTQVATALPYYEAFLDRFPSLASLAAASEPHVLAVWSGLGYYRRARQLHAAARIVVRDHGGHVPLDAATFAGLPGVGRYTTAAVLSICIDRPLAVLDGNVARVLSRLYALPAAIRDPRGAKRLWALAESLVPARRPGDWNQALMELGARVCTPRAPDCAACPARRACRAYALGRVAEFPPVRPRRRVEAVRRAVALVTRGDRVLLARREGALLGGLWEPPGVDLANGDRARTRLGAVLRPLGVRARLAPTGRTVRHTITHRAIVAEVWAGEMAADASLDRRASARRGATRDAEPPRARWVVRSRPGVPLTALARRLLRGD
ncbi:MAG: A/G-specific adenine glycosylase [Candidatus Eisenbacteria bacterium]|nr:A/G-specific adenine glycosylase [Candidatus Eisenbacteria bacterium]